MLYLTDGNVTAGYKADRRDSLGTWAIVRRTAHNVAKRENVIPTGEIIYLPMWAGMTVSEEESTMDIQNSMFAPVSEREVTARFTDSGSLEISFARELTTDDMKQYAYGLPAAVSHVARAERYTANNGDTVIVVVLREGAARYAFDIRPAAKAYTESFLARLSPVAKQVSMF